VVAIGNSGSTAVLWHDGRFSTLPTPGFSFTQLGDLNNRGVVVGAASSETTNEFRALLWH
jgi:hypothetical protein